MKIENEIEVGVGDMAVLQFSLTGIQHEIKKAVMMRAGGLTHLIDQEVKRAFTAERIEAEIKKAVEEEFQRSMKYGEGYQAVKKIVSEQVSKTIAKLAE